MTAEEAMKEILGGVETEDKRFEEGCIMSLFRSAVDLIHNNANTHHQQEEAIGMGLAFRALMKELNDEQRKEVLATVDSWEHNENNGPVPPRLQDLVKLVGPGDFIPTTLDKHVPDNVKPLTEEGARLQAVNEAKKRLGPLFAMVMSEEQQEAYIKFGPTRAEVKKLMAQGDAVTMMAQMEEMLSALRASKGTDGPGAVEIDPDDFLD